MATGEKIARVSFMVPLPEKRSSWLNSRRSKATGFFCLFFSFFPLFSAPFRRRSLTLMASRPGRRQRKGKPHTRHRCPWRCRKRGSVERRRCPRLALLSNRSEVSVPQYRMDAGCVSVFRWGIPHDYGRNARTGRCQTRQLWFRVRFWSPFGVLGSRMSAQIDLPILSRF
jgi:hypothetical protein